MRLYLSSCQLGAHPEVFARMVRGNVFTLRMAFAKSGLDRVVVEGLAADQFVYAGFSAGPCVLAPSLAGLELCDPPEACLRHLR